MTTKNTVTQEQVNEILNHSKIVWETYFGKTLVGLCKLPNGFVLVESSSCVDPANFSTEIGMEIIMERFANKIWELEGYTLQSKVGKE
jgi:hypothetical protein